MSPRGELRQRRPRVASRAYLAFVRARACQACCAPPPSQAAHVRGADAVFRKRETGKGEKPDDRWALPLCAGCHLDDRDSLHNAGEKNFFARRGIDPIAAAANLYDEFLAEGPKPRRARG